MAKVVLVVDDEQGIVSVLSRLLADEGWTVHTALSGAEALLVAKRVRPSVVLVDYIMPGMDGAALARALRRDAPSSPKLVMMSGLPESMISRKLKTYDAFLSKPFSFTTLLSTLDRTLAPPRAKGRRAR